MIRNVIKKELIAEKGFCRLFKEVEEWGKQRCVNYIVMWKSEVILYTRRKDVAENEMEVYANQE